MAFGDDPALDRAMAITMNRILIAKKIAEDPRYASYQNSPDFVLRAARWSYKELGWGRTDLDGYLEHCAEIAAKKKAKSSLFRTDSTLWLRIRQDIFQRDDYTCAYCGKRGGVLEVDHIHPVAKGGTDDYANLTTACFACNRSKRTKSADEFRAILANKD